MKKNILRTHIELNQQAFFYNIKNIKKTIGTTQLAIVVKSNAYGHGMHEIAQMCQLSDSVQWLCTAGLSEALALKKQSIQKPVIALSYLDADFTSAVYHDIHCGIYTYQDAYALNQAAQSLGKKAYIHIKIDTGMSRLGILPQDALNFIKHIQELSHLVIFGIFTHLCDTPNPDQSFSYLQLDRFDDLLDTLKEENIDIPCTHAQSSSALCIVPKRQYTLMRAGAFAYGIWKSQEHKNLVLNAHPDFDLQQVITWKTSIIQIKSLAAGSFIGYDKTYRTTRSTTIALLPIGYWDGYSRGLSNTGSVLINNQLAPVVGIVSMNLTAVDITDIIGATLESEVLLLGNYTGITARDLAQKAGVITNQVVTSICNQIPRSIVTEQEYLVDKQNSLEYKNI